MSKSKAFGSDLLQVRNFDREGWDKNCDVVVERGNLLKFTQHEDLKKVLLGTEDRILVEASPTDRIWGIGFDAEQALGHEDKWGENKLGKALMRVREQLRGPKDGLSAYMKFLDFWSQRNSRLRSIGFSRIYSQRFGSEYTGVTECTLLQLPTPSSVFHTTLYGHTIWPYDEHLR